ncbi:hypothetical protein BX600DRAFT_453905 [Xylariales sp. PMI_506]|nr:hypothetical protein BX600DRAFT_453905 [Xylariales sp. PMI_506]
MYIETSRITRNTILQLPSTIRQLSFYRGTSHVPCITPDFARIKSPVRGGSGEWESGKPNPEIGRPVGWRIGGDENNRGNENLQKTPPPLPITHMPT